MKDFGVDLSRWNYAIDFNALKNAGVKFVILKIGGSDNGLYKDRMFDTYYQKAKKYGFGVGAYFYGSLDDIKNPISNSQFLLKLLKNYKFEYPVYYDVEGKLLNIGKSELTEHVNNFCYMIEKGGYWTGIYMSQSAFNNEVDDEKLKHFAHWVARWNKNKPTLKSKMNVDLWQFGGEKNFINDPKIGGVTVDQDYCYKDYPTLIKSKGLNNL